MLRHQSDNDTICALSTAPGIGAIAVVRMSGEKSFLFTRMIFSNLPEKPETHKVYFGTLHTPDKKRDIDEVLVSTFHKGKSFTGEEAVEISCHGNPLIAQDILNALIACGARTAERGEFTYRAFMNGKIDLVQAESILSLIESKSQKAADQSLRQLKGRLSKEFEAMESDLIWCLANIEAGIDFSTEGIEVVDKAKLSGIIQEIQKRILKLISTYKTGRILRDGFRIALVGQPNVGKSSLLNLLLEEDKAIVTNIPGTTRDLIEGSFFVDGLRVVLTDTAGLRDSDDTVEKIGIQKSYKAQAESDLNFFVFDITKGISADELNQIERAGWSKTIIIGNKLDQSALSPELLKSGVDHRLQASKFYQQIEDKETFLNENVRFISALSVVDGESLKDFIQRKMNQTSFEDQALLAQARHFENLSRAAQNLERGEKLLEQDAGYEYLAIELKEALICVQEILGKRFDDDVLDRVFKEFCIGK